MEINPEQLADLGSTVGLLLVIYVTVRMLWQAFWPWYRDVCWPARETRWRTDREIQQTLVNRFLDAQEAARLKGLDDVLRGLLNVNDTLAQMRADDEINRQTHREFERQLLLIAADLSIVREEVSDIRDCIGVTSSVSARTVKALRTRMGLEET